MRYSCAIIFYNPSIEDIKRIDIYSKLFEAVYIMDNSDNKVIDIESKMCAYDNVRYIDMGGNKGMSLALENAFEISSKEDFDFCLTMDQDSNYSKSNIHRMMEYIEHNDREEVAIYVPNYSKRYWNSKNKKFAYSKLAISKEETKSVAFGMTSGSFVRLSAVKKILPLPNYFIAHVDNDICTRLIKQGYKVIMVGKSCMYQQVGDIVENTWINRNLGRLSHSKERYYYLTRNALTWGKIYKEDRKIYLSNLKGLFRIYINLIVFEKDKFDKIKYCIRGYKDYRRGILGKIPE